MAIDAPNNSNCLTSEVPNNKTRECKTPCDNSAKQRKVKRLVESWSKFAVDTFIPEDMNFVQLDLQHG